MIKGVTTLDDIALGINYNKEPYTTNERFSVITPDIDSQHKFFTVENYTHHFITSMPNDPNATHKNEACTQINPLAKPAKKVEAPTQAPIQPAPKLIPEETHEQKKEKTAEPKATMTPARHVKSSTTKTPMKTLMRVAKTFIKLPKKCSVYEPKELYSANDNSLNAKFGKTNPYSGTRYYNMEAVLGLNKNNTLGDVMRKSQEVESTTVRELKMQHNKKFLTTHGLPKIPEKRVDPAMIITPVNKNVAKKIGNEAHIRMTNGGYSRTTYGGYYMQ